MQSVRCEFFQVVVVLEVHVDGILLMLYDVLVEFEEFPFHVEVLLHVVQHDDVLELIHLKTTLLNLCWCVFDVHDTDVLDVLVQLSVALHGLSL